MPIANCFVAPSHSLRSSVDIVAAWAKESGKGAEQMTVNMIYASQQRGKGYAVMANLLLPSLWSRSDISLLQIGLAKALATSFGVDINQIHIVTSVISSGMVVENGQELKW